MSESLTKENVLIGTLIANVVGIFLLVFLDFAGWYNYGYAVESWGYIYFGLDNILTSSIMLGPLLCMSYCVYNSILPFIGNKESITNEKITICFLLSVIAFSVITVGALVFIIEMLSDEPTNWWFDTGFYGSFLGSGISAILFYIAKQQ